MTTDSFNYNTKLRTNTASKRMEVEVNGGLKTVESLRGRLLAERQVSRSVKEEAELMTRKMEELESYLKEEIRLREKAEKRLKFLMKKLEFIKGGSKSFEGSEKLSSSEASCLSSVSTSASKDGEEEEEDKTDQANYNVVSMEKDSSAKHKDVSSDEASVVASTSSHEEALQAIN